MKLNIFVCIIILSALSCQPQKPPVKNFDGDTVTPSNFREIIATDLSFDSTTGRIHYVLPEDALVRIRIGQDGPLFRTLVDWEKRKKGAHDEIWDFKDETGKVDFSAWKNFKIIFSARNIDSSTSDASIPVGLHKAPKIHISFPEIDMPNDKIVLKGVVSMRATVDEADFKWLSNSKTENIIFIDGVFLHEEEEGNNPFNYQLDTRPYNNGPHVLIINTVSYAGETGTAVLSVDIEN